MDLSLFGLAAAALRTRLVVRAPIQLYGHGLGWVFGRRVLLLEHRGRRTGQPRFACLEAVDHPTPARIVFVSGFGARADWYRNLLADPDCFVSTDRLRRTSAPAQFMTPAEASAALGRYQRAHPRAWHRLRRAIQKACGSPVEQLLMAELLLELKPA